MSLAIKAENISKAYRLGEIGTGTISRDIERWVAKLRGREDPFLMIGEKNDRTTKGNSDVVWSLRDISFEIKQGDAVGIIGRNGAGKSTLLKLLSRVTTPTTGEINVKGRIASLLEVGTGFHPELTGRENIYLNGAILGMRKKEISRKFDEIVEFAGVDRYIDTPVKRYSSGMYVRLAFAVAAHLDSEILIVDEVLAVGDADFQKKCLGKMGEVSRGEGRTVLFVSHNMGMILSLCNRSILLSNGTLDEVGETDKIVNRYASIRTGHGDMKIVSFDGPLTKRISFTQININGANPLQVEVLLKPREDMVIEIGGHSETNDPFQVSIAIFKDGIRLFTLHDCVNFCRTTGDFISTFHLDANLLRPGMYQIGVGARTKEDLWSWQEHVCNYAVMELWGSEIEKSTYGIINLSQTRNQRSNL